MNNFFIPLIRGRDHYDEKSSAGCKKGHVQAQKKTDKCFNKLGKEIFREGRSDHLLLVNVKILLNSRHFKIKNLNFV